MYPVAFASDYVPERSRLTTFLRYFMAIPVAIAGFFGGSGLSSRSSPPG